MIHLRELARSDIPIINRWRQDSSLTATLGAPHRHIGLEVDERWFEAYLERRGTDVRCAICRDGESEPIGLVSLTGVNPVHRHGELHILLGDRASHGQGIGTEATRAMLAHGFRDLNLHRIFLFVLASNLAARHMYEKVGFRLEGTLHESAFKNGSYEDVHIMGMLQSEFNAA